MNFSILKKFLARARAQNILPSELKYHDFWVFTAIWDLARAKNFFRIVKFVKKSRCNFFCLIITQKANFLEHFEVWKIFLKFHFFSKIFKFWKFSKKINFFLKKFKKSTHFKAIHNNQFNRYENIDFFLKISKFSNFQNF